MIIRRVVSLWHVILFAACFFAQGAKAQGPDTFVFVAPSNPTYTTNCFPITEWDGVANAYPGGMGDVCFAGIGFAVYSGIEAPFQLGYPNNGYLQGCMPTNWGPQVWTKGSQNVGGSTFYQTVTFSGCYDGGNTTVNATVNFQVLARQSCGRGRCAWFYFNIPQGGNGTIKN
jgi:hypothetical protein